MLVGSHVHLEKLFLVESNKEDTSSFSSTISENSQSAISVEDLNFRFFNSSEMFFENINLNI